MTRLALLLAAAVFLLALMAGQAQSPLPPWVQVVPAQDCSAGCWRIVEAEYLDEGASQGLHHIFAKTLDANGNQIVDRFTVAWADGSVTVPTKPPPDWGDSAMWGCFFPDQGEVGGYRAWAGIWEANSDTVSGMGMEYCHHVSYRIVWRWDNGGGGTATPTPPPTPSPSPTPAFRLWLPMVGRG